MRRCGNGFGLTVIFVGVLLYGVRIAWGFLWQRQHAAIYRQKSEAESKFYAIANAAQDAIIIMDAKGCVAYWNAAAEHILGYAASEAIGKDLHQLAAPQRYHAAYREALAGFQHTDKGATVGKVLELEARRKDGAEIAVLLSLSAVQVGDEWYAVGILRDETERRQAGGCHTRK